MIGKSLERFEDPALLTGTGVYADDVAVSRQTGHAAILRSPMAHASIEAIDPCRALTLKGVMTVLTGAEARAWSKPFIVSVKQPMEHRCLAIDRVRYVGEPVAIVIAENRYIAEDALELIDVDYTPLDPVIAPEEAALPNASLLHSKVGSNLVHERKFQYGDPQKIFAEAERLVKLKVNYPRNACTPIEGLVIVAEYQQSEDCYGVLANFQGPFTLHSVMSMALNVPPNRLRLRTPPDSGGSFGVKQSAFPYIVALCLAARKAGRPVKWVEDRHEHLMAATSATNRIIEIEAAVNTRGEIQGLRYDQLEDCGAYLRAPEPATLYRMHGNMTGPYQIQHLEIVNRVVLTNKTPTGLNRGFGGPQVYFALERLMDKIARELKLDPLEVIRRNLVPAGQFPHQTPSGALLDSGDYQAAVDKAVRDGRLKELEDRRKEMRAQGKLYGIGFAAIIEPSISNMGYITAVLTPEERRRSGPKDGAAATATVSLDSLGSISVVLDSTPQGQGHRTAVAQVVGEALGISPEVIRVETTMDTVKDAWSIAAGNYSSRFAGAVAGAAHLAAMRIRQKLAGIAQSRLNVPLDEIQFSDGQIYAADNPENALPLRRVAGIAHWSPSVLPEEMSPGLRETVFWSMPELRPPDDEDRVNSSGAYGFVFDFCGVEVDQDTGHTRIDKYVTMHDAGRLINPELVNGQIRGGFAQAVGAALYEEFLYTEGGEFLSGSFANYLVPTCCEIPDPLILHLETPSPFTPLGSKGVGEGNSMSTPVCIANAVADAIGVEGITLPLHPSRVAALIHDPERPPDSTSRRDS